MSGGEWTAGAMPGDKEEKQAYQCDLDTYSEDVYLNWVSLISYLVDKCKA